MTVRYAPHARAVRVRNIATGEVIEASPVDAREQVSHPTGGWEYVTDAPASPATADTPHATLAAATPDAGPSIADRLAEKSGKELKALAKKAGIVDALDRDRLIAALVPHIEGRTINIDEVKGLPPSMLSAQFPNATPAE